MFCGLDICFLYVDKCSEGPKVFHNLALNDPFVRFESIWTSFMLSVDKNMVISLGDNSLCTSENIRMNLGDLE